VLERTAVLVDGDGAVEARFTVGLPAQGRSIMGQWAAQILVANLPGWAVAGGRGQGPPHGRRAGRRARTERQGASTCLQPPPLSPIPLPRWVDQGLVYARQDAAAVWRHVSTVEDTDALRRQLEGAGLVAFVGDGAVLPRLRWAGV
jgi:hypothetical protein